MIESIGIRNLGVIESAQLALKPGFTVLTGETGAGKTMVLNALNLLIGGRADSSAVRREQASLLVEGSWIISEPELQERIQETGAMIEDSQLLVNRTVTADGRSRAALGGVQVPAGTLAEIAEQLVTVHGQSDQLRLRSTTAQRIALDDFGGAEVSAALAAYSATFVSYKELAARLDRQANATSQDQARVSDLRELISQIEKLNLQPGELAEIEERINRLSNVEHLQQAASLAHTVLTSDEQPAVLELLPVSIRSLEHSNDPILGALGARLSEIGSLVSEASAELASYLSDLEADPAQLDALNARKAAIVQLERRHGKNSDELLGQLPSLQSELLELDSSDEQLEKLEVQLAAQEKQLSHAATALTSARQKAAHRLVVAVNQELSQLAMGGVRFEVNISQLADFEASGIDRIEFMLANAGAELRPIAKGASGGELSRIMLAIELVLVASRPLPTMIFDEVDAGVGGQAALELGRRLKRLSERTQVIVVTHLPQVAAFADHQIQVTKDSSGEVTTSSVRSLTSSERRVELARMLSGNPDSEVALAHADELLNLA